VICPTAWSANLDVWIERNPDRVAAYEAAAPLRRIGDPVEDIGEGVVFLAGPQSRYVTGMTLMLDGGRTYLR
jgi:NAD(P)-dependent dehydrogenase (short-subunit alcohol dehydrogenase family)